ncbi:hypothetical protein AMTRI_Chr04g242560 [Amborella trichopoda]
MVLNMALTASSVLTRNMVFNDKHLASAIYYEVQRGYRNAIGGSMRFSKFLFSKLLKICTRSNHKSAKKLLGEADKYGTSSMFDRTDLLNKVSVFMGYNSVRDLMEHERARRESAADLNLMKDFDMSVACKNFPSIKLGSASVVELYDEIARGPGKVDLLLPGTCKEYLSNSMREDWMAPTELIDTWHGLNSSLSARSTSVLIDEETLLPSVETSHSLRTEPEEKFDDRNKTQLSSQNMTDMPECNANVATEDFHPGAEYHLEETMAPSIECLLDKPIASMPSLSKGLCRKLEKNGFHTMRKLLHHFPRVYADLYNARGVIQDGQYLNFVGKVLLSRGVRAGASLSIIEVLVGCEVCNHEEASEIKVDDHDTLNKRMVYLHLKKFFRGVRFTSQPFLRGIQSKHKEGDIVSVSGKVKAMKAEDHFELKEFHIDVLQENAMDKMNGLEEEKRPYPIYPSKGGLNSNFLRDIILRALQALPTDMDPIPSNICADFDLFNLHDAYMGIHCPKDLKEADLARKRLVFDEFFYLQLGRMFQMLEKLGTWAEKSSLLERYKKNGSCLLNSEEWSDLTRKIYKALPYALTPSQLNAVSEIIWDLRRSVPMSRLLQGDVGCGKTVVAFLACMEVIDKGYQAAFMVPTELLALQHYEHILSLLQNIDEQSRPSVALLTRSVPSKQSRIIRKGLQTGDIALVIGTHSLISESVEFLALRLAVIDEQHRFGVIQRGKFNSKLYYSSEGLKTSVVIKGHGESSEDEVYMAPHVLAMSATPIPRTLALVLYGDMSLSQITHLPPGRVPVETHVLEGNLTGFERMYEMIKNELQEGGKIYLVYPIIEESEQLPQLRAATAELELISGKFEGYQCGLLHGRLKSTEKEEALRRFKSGETRILLATQVIEIGVDVPDASMMVVMNAERFGIAQLHQLRGRVGRGQRKSKCIFMSCLVGTMGRLNILKESCDGYYLANMDLVLRGPGNLLGKKQSGHLPEFPISMLEVDGNIIEKARLVALKILDTHNGLDGFPLLKAELSMRQPLCLLGD